MKDRARGLRQVGVTVGFAVALLAVRWALSGRLQFTFMLWNLALGLVPVACAYAGGQRLFPLRLGAWWLFFPNAPYMITDLVHLRPRNMPYWFDVGMMVALAWAGLVAACVSLRWMQGDVRARWGRTAAQLFLPLVAATTGFAIWLGRFLRLNSWDAVVDPQAALGTILHALIAGKGPQALGVTLLFGAMLWVVYRTSAHSNTYA